MQSLERQLMLNPEQDAAMRHIHGPLLVLAGAGSGKTRVITHKIAHLIRHCGHQPQHIGAITFTNKAAREMKSRAGALLTDLKRSPLITTFHSLGLRLLQQDGELAGLRKGFSILDAEDCRALLRELTRKELELGDRELLQIQARLSAWKNDLIEPAQAHAQAEDELTLRDARIYLEYERHCAPTTRLISMISSPCRCVYCALSPPVAKPGSNGCAICWSMNIRTPTRRSTSCSSCWWAAGPLHRGRR